ncbi:VOC family protein [Aidingimonas lacisalsi]|uniref:VOC family protein n=1 Tax=Aidingimonas lacisalsi TaxID=2604086 RepID=UPI0011D27218|nr:VOC family protein [Aidingimonas lacisalsi]
MPELSLLVVRVSDLERSRSWYERLGFKFSEEQHGDGPVHYAAEEANFVFEIYPESASNPVSSAVRLDFRVQDVREIVDTHVPSASVVGEPEIRSGRLSAVLVDPDGIKVEISEAKT